MRVLLSVAMYLSLSPAGLPATEKPKKRLAHIGLELDGSWSFLKQAQDEPEAELVALADTHPELLEKAKTATRPGTKFFADYVRGIGSCRS